MSDKPMREWRPCQTKGRGDCAIHALFGTKVNNEYQCSEAEVKKRRQFLKDQVSDLDISSDHRVCKAVVDGMRERIEEGVGFGKDSQPLIEDDQLLKATRNSLKDSLRQHVELKYKHTLLESDYTGSPSDFSSVLNQCRKKHAPEFNKDEKFNKLWKDIDQNRFNISQYLQSPNTREKLLKSYADCIGTIGCHLLRCELVLLAWVNDIHLILCSARASGKHGYFEEDCRFNSDSADEAAHDRDHSPPVRVYFNDRHYERMENSSHEDSDDDDDDEDEDESDDDGDEKEDEPSSSDDVIEKSAGPEDLDPEVLNNEDKYTQNDTALKALPPAFQQFVRQLMLKSARSQTQYLRTKKFNSSSTSDSQLLDENESQNQLEDESVSADHAIESDIALLMKQLPRKSKFKQVFEQTPSKIQLPELKKYLKIHKCKPGTTSTAKLFECKIRVLCHANDVELCPDYLFVRNENRDASKTIAGFAYQAQQSLDAWLNLSPFQILVCEGTEDMDVIGVSKAVERAHKCHDAFSIGKKSLESMIHIQVKHQQHEDNLTNNSLTLKNDVVKKCIAQCVDLMRSNHPDFIYLFLCRSKPPVTERSGSGWFKSNGIKAIPFWQQIQQKLFFHSPGPYVELDDKEKEGAAEIWNICNEICEWAKEIVKASGESQWSKKKSSESLAVSEQNMSPLDLKTFIRLIGVFRWQLKELNLTQQREEIQKKLKDRVERLSLKLPSFGHESYVLNTLYSSLVNYISEDVLSKAFHKRPTLISRQLNLKLQMFCQDETVQSSAKASSKVWDVINSKVRDSQSNKEGFKFPSYQQLEKEKLAEKEEVRKQLIHMIRRVQDNPRKLDPQLNFHVSRLDLRLNRLKEGKDLSEKAEQEVLKVFNSWLDAEEKY